jgi:hypothetical protein
MVVCHRELATVDCRYNCFSGGLDPYDTISAFIKPNLNGSNHLIRRLIDIKLSLFGLITINQTKLD